MSTIECPKCGATNDESLRVCGRCGTALNKGAAHPSSRAPRNGAAPGRDSGVSFRKNQVVAKRYTVLDIIGRGGMGCIYRVHDNTLNEEVALKTLLPQFARDKLVVERFYNEARIARQLSHPAICRVHDIGIDGDVMYISMEVLKGRSLRNILDHLPPGQRLSVRATLHIVDQLCAALEYAHQYTVHRDIKPENVMVAADGAVKLMDFGISKLVASGNLTSASVVMGTPQYMPPEQLKDSRGVDARADIFSLGVVLYEMLTGNLPTGIPKPASQVMQEVPPSLDPIIAKCVDPSPAQRYQSAKELREAIRPIRELLEAGAALDAQGPTTKTSPSKAFRRAVGAALALVVFGVAGLGWQTAEKHRLELISNMGLGTTIDLSGPGEPTTIDPRLAPVWNHIEHLEAAAASKDPGSDTLNEGVKWFDAAKQAASANTPSPGAEEDALRSAYFAAQCFTAIIEGPPNGMAFIPPGEVSLNGTSTFVPGFYIDLYEVTITQFTEFLKTTHEYRPGPSELGRFQLAQGKRPVSMITHYDATAYAAASGKRLPTEAEWARAAYGYKQGSQNFPWGDNPEDGECAQCAAANPAATLAEVGSFPADHTQSGCYDMAGNVQEWTATPAAGANPSAPSFSDKVVIRGGAGPRETAALSRRTERQLGEVDPCLGFRCVQDLTISGLSTISP